MSTFPSSRRRSFSSEFPSKRLTFTLGCSFRQGPGQHIGTAHSGKGQVQHAHVVFEDVRQLHVKIVFELPDPARVVHVALACVGQNVSVAQAAEELQPQIVLQGDQELAQRRLGDVEGVGGLGDVLVLGNRQHVAQIAKVHEKASFIRFLYLTTPRREWQVFFIFFIDFIPFRNGI